MATAAAVATELQVAYEERLTLAHLYSDADGVRGNIRHAVRKPSRRPPICCAAARVFLVPTLFAAAVSRVRHMELAATPGGGGSLSLASSAACMALIPACAGLLARGACFGRQAAKRCSERGTQRPTTSSHQSQWREGWGVRSGGTGPAFEAGGWAAS